MRIPTLFSRYLLSGFLALSAVASVRATDSTLDPAFTATISPGLTPNGYPAFDNGTGAVNAVALQSDGKILAGGNISRYQAPAAGSPQTSLKRLNADGTFDAGFDAFASTLADTQGQPEVNALLVTSTDKIYVGGVFQSYEGMPRSGILRLNANGSLDGTFNLGGISTSVQYGVRYVLAIQEQSDGKVLVGGAFNRLTTDTTVAVNNLVRLNSDGSRDTLFSPNAALTNSAVVSDIAVLPNGQILVAGGLNKPGGGTTPLLLRLNADGSLDTSFYGSWANEYGDIDELLVLPDGRIVIGGDFMFAGSSTHQWVACLKADGTPDTAFMANLGTGPNGWTGGELALQPDGSILVGGIFSFWNGQPRASIARLLPDGTLDSALAVPPYSMVHGQYLTHMYSFAVQPDGKIVAGGWFNRVTDPALETYNLVRIMNEYSATGAGTLRMTSAAATTTELATSITIPVSRFGGLTGAVGVSYSITAGNAVAGTDYTAVSGTLSWAANEGGLKTITVPILPDAAADGTRTFTVTLSNPTGGATLPAGNASTVVSIRDDEGAPTITSSPVAVSLEQGGAFTLRMRYDSVLAAAVQWQLDTGSGFANVPGATGTSYTVSVAAPLTHAGTYRAVVTNANGFANSGTALVSISVPAGSLVTTFTPPSDTPAVATAGGLAIDTAGRFLLVSSTGLRRMNADGTLEPTTSFGISVSGAKQVLALADGRTVLGGALGTLTHQPSGTTSTASNRLVRIKADGTIDTYAPTINGTLQTLAPGASGKYYVGSSVAIGAQGLQRFLGDGSVDATFASSIPTTGPVIVYAVKEQPDGKILVSYTQVVTGTTTYRLSRLTATGTMDSTFGTAGTVVFNGTYFNGMDVLPDGRIAVSCYFNPLLLGSQQQWVGLLSSTGVPDPGFVSQGMLNSRPMGVIYRDGRLLVWGEFTTVNGVAPRGLVRLNLDGSVDNTFSIGAGSNDHIYAAKYTTTGDIFIAGSFTTFKSVTRNKAALLVGNPHIAALGFDPMAVTTLEDAAVLPLTLRRYGSSVGAVSVDYATVNGTALAGTDFTSASGTVSWGDGDSADKTIALNLLDNANVEATRSFRVTLSNASGPAGPAAGVTVNFIDDDTPVSITTQPVAASSLYDTQALVLSVTATSPSAISYQWYRNGIAIPGATTASYNAASVTAVDSGVYHVRITNAAGTYLSTPSLVAVRRQAGRLAANQVLGGRPVFTGATLAIAALNDGGVLVGGNYSPNVIGNVPRSYLTRVKADGTTDGSFYLPLNNSVVSLLRQPDGKILVGGVFTGVTDNPGITARRLIRLNSDLTLDTAFNAAVAPNLTFGEPMDIALQPDGAVLLAINNTGGYGAVMRFTTTGALDSTFGSSGIVSTTGNYPTALAVLNDGDILVGGYFSNIASANPTKSRLARLNSDGTVDYGLTNGIGGSAIFNDLLVLADGRVFAAGSNFSNSSSLTLVNPDGSFGSNIATTNQVFKIAQASDGKILVARTSGSGSSSNRVYRLLGSNPLPSPGSADGDATFNVGTGPDDADARVLTIAPDGSVWIAGQFTTFNGIATGGVARLDGDPVNPAIVNQPAATGVAAGDTAFIGVGASGTGLTYQWYKGGILLPDGGNISGATSPILTVANVSATDVADYTVTVTGGAAPTTVTSAAAHLYLLGTPVVHADPLPVSMYAGQNATLTAQVFALPTATFVWKRDGVIIVDGGRFSDATTASLTLTGALASDTGSYTLTVTNTQGQVTTTPAFVLIRPIPHERAPAFATLAASLQVNAIYPLPDGRMVVAGSHATSFTGGAGGTTSPNTAIAVIKPDGSYDANPTLPLSSNGTISAIARQSDGKWIIGGTFTAVGGLTRNYVARLNANFTVDTTFNAGTGPNGTVATVAVDATGKIYIGGSFSQFNGVTGAGRAYLARLNTDGSLDTTFTVSVSYFVYRILPVPSGGFLVAGAFYNPTNIIRLDATGAVVGSFTGPTTGGVFDLALTPDGTSFYAALSQDSPYVRRYLVSTGAVDPTFVIPQLNSNASRLAVQPDGKLIIAGGFSGPCPSPTRLLTSGLVDPTFVPLTQIGSHNIMAMVVTGSGRIWLGGSFTALYGTTNATRLLVLNGDVPTLAFATHPATVQVEGGQTATFTAEAVATSGLEYRWYKGATMVTNGGRVSGATGTTLTITNVNPNDEGMYTLRATSATAGTIISQAAELIYLGAPEIVTAAAGGTFEAGTSSTLTVTARGAAPLSYQWFKGNATTGMADISGATSASYMLANPATTDTSYYGVRVTNGLGSVQTTPVLVTYASYAASTSMQTPVFGSSVNKVQPLADGSFVAAGNFSSVTPVGGSFTTRRGIVHILANGTNDTAFNQLAANDSILDFAIDSQGRYVAVGYYTSYATTGGNVTRNSIGRLSSAGVLDTGFNAALSSANSNIACVAVDTLDRPLIGGSFFGFGGASGANYLVRLDATSGIRDSTFSAAVSGSVYVVLPLADGTMLVGVQGNPGLMRLLSTGAVDSGFAYSGGLWVSAITPVPNSTDYIIGGVSGGVQRITASGALVTPWPATGTSGSNGSIKKILFSNTGGIFIGGDFTSYNGITANRLALLNANGTLNTGFATGTGFDGTVSSLARDSSNRLWVAGNFSNYRGAPVNKLVILNGFDTIPADPGAPPTALQTYLASAGIPVGQRGPLDDPDLDGLSNLLEYALDLPPNTSSAAGLPVATAAGAQFTFTYRRAKGDVTYVVQTSPDLSPGSWTSVGVDQGTPLSDGTTTASIPLTGGQQFLRLSVSQ